MATIEDVRELLSKGYDPRSTVNKLGIMLREEPKPKPEEKPEAKPEKKKSLLRRSAK